MIRLILAFLLSLSTAVAQTPPVFTGRNGGAAGPGDPIKLQEMLAAIASKQDFNGVLTAPTIAGTATVNGPLVWLNPSPTLHTAYAGGGLTNGVIISAGGNQVSYCPVLSCVTSPSTDHQRTSALFWSTTSDDGHSEEQTVAVQTIMQTGAYSTWAPSTAYALGANVKFSDARNAVYRATQGGISAASGSGPTGKGSGIVDGSVVWTWINDGAINGKVGIYNETAVKPGAGDVWAQANNIHLLAGYVPRFAINTEFDFFNDAAECVPGVANCNALEISMGGAYRSSTGIHLSSPNVGPIYASRWGIRLNGDYLASDASIDVTGTSQVGLGFGTIGFGTSRHGTASIQDQSTSPVSLLIQGSHSASSINDTAATPAAVNLSGTYGLAAIRTQDASTTTALLAKAGQKVCWTVATDAFCMTVDPATSKMTYSKNTTALFSVDGSGNVRALGTITGSVAP